MKKLIGLFAFIFLLLGSTLTVEASTHYTLVVTIDTSKKQYAGMVLPDRDKHIAYALGYQYQFTVLSGGKNHIGINWKLPTEGLSIKRTGNKQFDQMEDEDRVYVWPKFAEDENNYFCPELRPAVFEASSNTGQELKINGQGYTPNFCIWSFPSILEGKGDRSADAMDNNLAERINSNVIPSLNNALSWCTGQAKKKTSDVHMSSYMKLASYLGNKKTSETFTWKGVTFQISVPSKEDVKDICYDNTNFSDYVKITNVENNQSRIFLYRIMKGYTWVGNREDTMRYQPAYQSSDMADTDYISWKQVVLQGNYNAQIHGITYSNVAQVTEPSTITKAVSDICNSALNSISGMMGLHAIDELILNLGNRSQQYFLGVFPNNWKVTGYLFYYICSTLAWALLAFSIVRLLNRRQLATMNVVERVEMKDGIRNVIITAALIGFFPLLFDVIAKLNYSLVQLFMSTSDADQFTTAMNAGSSTLGAIIVDIAFFSLRVYYNFFYVMRAITTMFLFVLSPLCFYAFSLGGKFKKISSNFMKELLGCIFIQSIHALLLVTFLRLMAGDIIMTTFETVVIMYSFIPLTKVVRSKIFGLGGDLADEAAGLGRGKAMGVLGAGIGIGMGLVGSVGAGIGSKITKKGGTIGPKSSMSGSPGGSSGGSQIGDAMDGYNQTKDVKLKDASKSMGINPGHDTGTVASRDNKFQSANKGLKKDTIAGGLGGAAKAALNIGTGVAAATMAVGMVAGGDTDTAKALVKNGEGRIKEGGAAARESVQSLKKLKADTKLMEDMQRGGIQGLYADDTGKNFAAIYDAKYNHENGYVKDPTPRNLNEQNVMKDLANLNSKKGKYVNEEIARDAWNHYHKQGITGVSEQDEKMCIHYNQSRMDNKNYNCDPLHNAKMYTK